MDETNVEKLERIKLETETLWKVSPNLKWLIEQAEKVEGLQKDVDFFIKRQKINTVIIQELVALNEPRVVEILTKTRIIG